MRSMKLLCILFSFSQNLWFKGVFLLSDGAHAVRFTSRQSRMQKMASSVLLDLSRVAWSSQGMVIIGGTSGKSEI